MEEKEIRGSWREIGGDWGKRVGGGAQTRNDGESSALRLDSSAQYKNSLLAN